MNKYVLTHDIACMYTHDLWKDLLQKSVTTTASRKENWVGVGRDGGRLVICTLVPVEFCIMCVVITVDLSQ